MADKLMYIINDDTQNSLFIDYNYWLKRLDTQPNEPTYQYSSKVLKVLEPTYKKTLKN